MGDTAGEDTTEQSLGIVRGVVGHRPSKSGEHRSMLCQKEQKKVEKEVPSVPLGCRHGMKGIRCQ